MTVSILAYAPRMTCNKCDFMFWVCSWDTSFWC